MAAEARHQLTGPRRDGHDIPVAAPSAVPLAPAEGARDEPVRLTAHGCWYPSADPYGARVAFICDRGGVPQLWTGPVDGEEAHLLDAGPDPVSEVSWSPDGRWIAYTTRPGGGEHSRVLCVRPDGTGRRVLAGAEPGTSAYLGCWLHDGSAVAVTVAAPAVTGPATAAPGAAPPGEPAEPGEPQTVGPAAGWSERDGHAVLLGGTHRGDVDPAFRAPGATPFGGAALPGTGHAAPGAPSPGAPTVRAGNGLAAYLIDPDGVAAPVLVAVEGTAATLRVCDVSRDGRLAVLRRGPRNRREAVVVRLADLRAAAAVPVADGDPWVGAFSPDGSRLWLRSDADREFAALLGADLAPDGSIARLSVAAERAGVDLELLAVAHEGRGAFLAWNDGGVSELEFRPLPGAAPNAPDAAAPATEAGRAVPLPHEVATRVVPAGTGGAAIALSGSRRRPGIWWLPGAGAPLMTSWSSRDEDAVPPGRRPTRPVRHRFTARDGMPLSGWYYRAPGRAPTWPAPCVIHLHGGPEEQERPVLDPLYHELLGRGFDVFAPDVRGSSGHGRTFVDADLGTGRFAAIEDVADCAAHAVLAGPADPSRLAVMGRSYGGYLVMASLVWHPELFRTGVAVCGMSDFQSFFAGTEPWIAESAAHKYGHPERDRDLLRSLSPLHRVDALRVPVLAVHGEYDTNVPPGESEQFVRAARERGIAAELLTLRDEGHEFQRADNRRLFRRTAADWLERHLIGGGAGAAPFGQGED
ncbi:prolyl oligopeptidase family serine peptidase [Streptomyces sp. TRM76323]|uniref:Prolyl oligopeptidase family serine peptidase n=1 Tax=Streptomyces tamarix TaxID=3078565 RepID=A0ABU3QJE3_9ACTN|nr:prolyl oligopeptidase family serine peptidase [Streptomyces tamarix]MDT9682895.1 prolyl oligopeptidase family serine peptidase [Streptomyces tamarix]